MKTRFDHEHFKAVPLVGILRHRGMLDYAGLVEAVLAGGLTTLELSFTHAGAAIDLAGLVAAAAGRLNLGAGTITTLARLAEARATGASFIVTPMVVAEVVDACVASGVPIFPGAFTPTEIVAADAMGATMVKLFPAVSLGIAFVAQLKATMPELRLLPTGGIGCADIAGWKRAGADGLGLGGGLFPAALLANRDWAALSANIRRHVAAWQALLLSSTA
ncbi:MAG: bifunctional 4-hydroxy-2-oxoglutarate aldolase/2-dehydro-3-deoxy-phosphogluconate aldolase [Undibacterium sp.]|nr:bifunctional 4-hydroxy-2-oxoglutarate aldolase/2-dehydro-3-deoxy-phosphogluconate aldolase [Opitutaceae bacterium]